MMYRVLRSGVAVPADWTPPPPPAPAPIPDAVRAKLAALRQEFAARANAKPKGVRR